MGRLVVAVETVKVGDGVTAAAVVYPAGTPVPTFSYKNRRGERRVVRIEECPRLPGAYRSGVLKYLKQSALSWAVVTRRDKDRESAMCLAVARALERLAHFRPEAVAHRSRITVLVPAKTPLPEDVVGELPQQLVDKMGSWFQHAAAALAKAPRACILAQ